MPQTVADIIAVLEEMAPGDLAESWDNVGLQVGDPSAKLEQVLIALDPTLAAVDAAAEGRVDHQLHAARLVEESFKDDLLRGRHESNGGNL